MHFVRNTFLPREVTTKGSMSKPVLVTMGFSEHSTHDMLNLRLLTISFWWKVRDF